MNEMQMKNDNAGDNEPNSGCGIGGSLAVVGRESAPSAAKVTLRTLRAETEMQAISQALAQTGWNRKRAAQLLSISYRGLLYKIRQHNITKDQSMSGVPKRAKMADTLNWDSPVLPSPVAGSEAKIDGRAVDSQGEDGDRPGLKLCIGCGWSRLNFGRQASGIDGIR